MSDFLSKKGKHMETKGLVLINTGTGKGKTTAALGTAIRAWGDGQKVLILQFIKGAWKYGELKAIETLGKAEGRIEIRPMGDGFVFHNKKDPENEERLAEKSAAIYFFALFAIIGVSAFAISTDNLSLETNLSAVLSCTGNTGPGYGAASSNFACFSWFSKIILSLDMLFGRLEIFPLLIALTPGVWKKKFF